MSNAGGPQPARQHANTPVRWLLIGLAVVLVVILIRRAPLLVMLLGMAAIILGLIAMVLGRIRWARISSRRVAGGMMGIAAVLFLASALVFGNNLPEQAAKSAAGDAAPTTTAEASPTTYLGQPCDDDGEVAIHGEAIENCDAEAGGALVWVSHATHEQAQVAATKALEAKLGEEARMRQSAEKQLAAETKTRHDVEKKLAQETKARKSVEKKLGQEAGARKAAERKLSEEMEARRSAEKQLENLGSQPAPERNDTPKAPRKTAPRSVYYKNCDAVRAAGAAPIHRGEPGYASHLDRDGDGVGCE